MRSLRNIAVLLVALGLIPSPAAAFVDVVIVRAAVLTPEGEAPVIDGPEIERLADTALSFTPRARPISRAEGRDIALEDKLRDCGYDVECVTKLALVARAHWVLMTIVNAELSPPLIASRLVEVASGKIIAERAAPMPAEGRVADAVLQQLLDVLVAGRFDVGGRLVVRPVPPDAKVSVTPSPMAPFAGELLAPGAYEALIEHDGYAARTESVVLRLGATTTLDVALEAEGSIVSSPWLWLGLGVLVVGAAATGAAFALSGGDQVVDFCHAGSPDSCN